jgi:23S rRNA A2030 N6-methylase RlmJ
LARSGLLVVNPPFTFAGEMETALAAIASPLQAKTRLDWLAGED